MGTAAEVSVRISSANSMFYQPVAKQIAKASGAENFNILQNNGRIAHQVVDHVSNPALHISLSINLLGMCAD